MDKQIFGDVNRHRRTLRLDILYPTLFLVWILSLSCKLNEEVQAEFNVSNISHSFRDIVFLVSVAL